MKFNYVKDFEELSKMCADIMIDEIVNNKTARICLATGSSPERAYELFVSRVLKEKIDLSEVEMVKLDEWVGVSKESEASCEKFLQSKVIQPLGLEKQFISMDQDKDLIAETKRVHEYLEENPLDLCILGFGKNGHLGFNEPKEYVNVDAFISELTSESQTHKMIQNENANITKGISLGIGDILNAKHIILLMHGTEKKALFEKFKERKVTSLLPASFLWLHNNVDVVIPETEFDK